MKISIITVCRNSADTIEDAILSVLNQKNIDLEYIIIDGGSTDGTMDIINKYKDKIVRIISEKDNGVYDAMNKGIALATGDVVGIINSDDFYRNDNILEEVAGSFREGADAVYGDLLYVSRSAKDKIVRNWKAGEYDPKNLKRGWIPPHPTFFVKKEAYQKYGVYNADFKIAGDYELMLRFLTKGARVFYLKKDLVCMREGGHSAKNIFHRLKGWRELYKAWRVNGLRAPTFFVLVRTVSKLSQYF